MRAAPAVRALGLLAALAAVAGVAILGLLGPGRARNYTDPQGPLYTTAHGSGAGRRDLVRVVSFNVQFALHVDRAIEVLRSTPTLRGCDLLLLQEMDEDGTERIARALAMNSAYAPGTVHPRTRRDFGNAVLSPWPILDARKLLLPHESRGIAQRRVAVVATVNVGGRPVRAYAVHVETRLRMSGRERRDQANAVLDDARGWPGPVVVAGDFNGSDLVETFEAAGYLHLGGSGGTLASPAPFRWLAFDHVFARGLLAADAGVEDARGASDHRPVWALARFR